MQRDSGLRITSWALLVAALLFYATSVSGLLFGGPSAPHDLGVYAVTITLLGLAAGGFLLRWARRTTDADQA